MNNKTYKKNRNQRKDKNQKNISPESYRFRRVLGDILNYLKSLPDQQSFENCQQEYETQVTELIQKGYTWGFAYPIPVHDTDFKSLQKKEWAAIRAIVRKQEYRSPNTRH